MIANLAETRFLGACRAHFRPLQRGLRAASRPFLWLESKVDLIGLEISNRSGREGVAPVIALKRIKDPQPRLSSSIF